MNDLISIIIPVYKVEQYLPKCIQSVINQTYKNLEIILVNDGSPDNCGEICNKYARLDPRVKVIHKENGGLSDARNAGLNISQGEYIGFVDSDDWIEPGMYEGMLASITKNSADIAVCCYKKITNDSIWVQDIHRTKIYSNQKALYELINDKTLSSFAWNKLYKRELFNDLEYPVGRIFEDIILTYQLFIRAQKVVHINKVYYNYQRRNDSILADWPISVQIEFCRALQDRYCGLTQLHPEFEMLILKKYLPCFYPLRGKLLNCPNDDITTNIQALRKFIFPFVKQNWGAIWRSNKLSPKKRLTLKFFLFTPRLYRYFYHIFKK